MTRPQLPVPIWVRLVAILVNAIGGLVGLSPLLSFAGRAWLTLAAIGILVGVALLYQSRPRPPIADLPTSAEVTVALGAAIGMTASLSVVLLLLAVLAGWGLAAIIWLAARVGLDLSPWAGAQGGTLLSVAALLLLPAYVAMTSRETDPLLYPMEPSRPAAPDRLRGRAGRVGKSNVWTLSAFGLGLLVLIAVFWRGEPLTAGRAFLVAVFLMMSTMAAMELVRAVKKSAMTAALRDQAEDLGRPPATGPPAPERASAQPAAPKDTSAILQIVCRLLEKGGYDVEQRLGDASLLTSHVQALARRDGKTFAVSVRPTGLAEDAHALVDACTALVSGARLLSSSLGSSRPVMVLLGPISTSRVERSDELTVVHVDQGRVARPLDPQVPPDEARRLVDELLPLADPSEEA